MADQDNDKFKFRAPEDNRHKYEPKKWEKQAFQGVSPMDFYVRQNQEKKKVKEREAEEAARRYNYKAKVLSDEEMHAKRINEQKEHDKQLKREEIEKAKHFNLPAASFELEKRKEEHERDAKWKETKRGQAKVNANFDMARSLFAGGGGATAEESEEEE